MRFGKDRPLWRFKWHFAIVYIGFVAIILLTIFTDILQILDTITLPQPVWLLGGLLLLLVVLVMLSKASRTLDTVTENGARLEKIAEGLEKNRSVLMQISQNTRLSETARAIAFRDVDREALREVVFEKLQQQDFETTYKVIDEIASRPEYRELAGQFRAEADKYRDATDQERTSQVIAYIDKLLEDHQWTKASLHIERLIKARPTSEKAKAMRQKLFDRKQERKKILLTAWDDAVKRQATDRSIEILRELDLYLTPNEGLALQEAARDVFRTKLHNLGVRFSLMVSGKQWDKALEIGQQIMRDFPNSRMAEEMREKWDILKQKAEQ